MTTPAYAPARPDGAEIRPGPPCPCEARVGALELELAVLRERQDRLHEVVRDALAGLGRSWRSTHVGHATSADSAAADGQWGSQTGGGTR